MRIGLQRCYNGARAGASRAGSDDSSAPRVGVGEGKAGAEGKVSIIDKGSIIDSKAGGGTNWIGPEGRAAVSSVDPAQCISRSPEAALDSRPVAAELGLRSRRLPLPPRRR
jgi:hypothetical protein